MNKLTLPIITVCIAMIAIIGCRKDDATPYYNYIGGATQTGPSESPGEGPEVTPGGDEPDPSSIKSSRDLETTSIDMTACMLFQSPAGEGIIETADDFTTKWNDWCAGKPLPDVDFETNFIAYYFRNVGGCEEVEFKGARLEDGEIKVDIEKTRKTGSCYCPLIMKYRRFLVAVERAVGTPSFNETVIEIPCE